MWANKDTLNRDGSLTRWPGGAPNPGHVQCAPFKLTMFFRVHRTLQVPNSFRSKGRIRAVIATPQEWRCHAMGVSRQ